MKHKKILYTLLMMVCLLLPSQLEAQEYNISYKKQTLEQVISDLRKKTGYEFVYQKQILMDTPPITCTYHNVTLNQILDLIFYNAAEIDYEIIEKTVILSKLEDSETPGQYLITGLVTDENGEVLPGANIRQRETNSGALTDINGVFHQIGRAHV